MEKQDSILRKIERTVMLGALLGVVVFLLVWGITAIISIFKAIVEGVIVWLADYASYATFAIWN